MSGGRAVRLLVAGRVQGVGFRWFARREALALGLAGWVRNLPDGRVEALAAGEPAAVAAFVDRLRQGPPGSRVAGVEEEPAAPPDGDGFDIVR